MKKRQEQVSHVLQQKLAGLINRECEFPQDSLVTVNKVSISGDLRFAEAFVSIFPLTSAGKIFSILSKKRILFQSQLGRAMKLRCTPELHFKLDFSLEGVSELEKILDTVHEQDVEKKDVF